MGEGYLAKILALLVLIAIPLLGLYFYSKKSKN